jgi:FKBP-type peptidyl-prolyl cis-trans isomerase
MISKRVFVLVGALLAFPALASAQREKLPPDDLDYVEARWPDAKKSNTGIRYIVETPGDGKLLHPGDKVFVTYIGSTLRGKVFDKQLDMKNPFSFRIARDEVIEGWDQILQLMSPGAKWIVIIPPELAYGRRGMPPRIAPDSTLVFELTILRADRETP